MALRSSSDVVLIWKGTTPGGYPLVVERDERNRWIATVAALLEAAATDVGRTHFRP